MIHIAPQGEDLIKGAESQPSRQSAGRAVDGQMLIRRHLRMLWASSGMAAVL
jgi:hypothetical protein